MAITPPKTTILRPSKAPNLPISPVDYSQQYNDQLLNALRLYFAQIDNFESNLATNPAIQTSVYGAYHDLTTQTATSTTVVYPIQITGVVDYQNGFSIVTGVNGPTQITAAAAGLYNFQYSLQLSNPNAAISNTTVWWRQNGIDIINSASTTSIVGKHGSINGLTVLGINFIQYLNAKDNLELFWQSDTAGCQIVTLPAVITPPNPISPGVIVTVFRIA
jgi:hypothetical protein